MTRKKGWKREPARHSLAARGKPTAVKLKSIGKKGRKFPMVLTEYYPMTNKEAELVPDLDEIEARGDYIGGWKDTSGEFETIEVFQYDGNEYEIGRNPKKGESIVIGIVHR